MQDKANMSLTVTCYTYMCVHVCTSHVHVYLQYVLDSAAETTVQQKQNCMIFIYARTYASARPLSRVKSLRSEFVVS